MKKEKRFEKPLFELVEFVNDDIVTTSGESYFGDEGNDNTEQW